MKSNVNTEELGTFSYVYNFSSNAILYTASGKRFNSFDLEGAVSTTSSGKGPKVAEIINEGKLDFNKTFVFGAEGKRM